ncbi:MAG: MBL fold metallo-hydrolase, partial [Planctomycetes bacterium]|nr:MBL fold metallo-hydrolase [Planctomycetota bacterium]
GAVTRLSDHLAVHHGAIQVGIVIDGERALLIDAGDASVLDVLGGLGVRTVDRVLFTHHHRDQACGAYLLAERGARITVPAAERDWFEKVEGYWESPKSRWHIYSFHPHSMVLAEPVRVDDTVADGTVIEWGPARILVLSTPGHTDGSVSYIVEADGGKVCFSGDAIYDAGQVWDIHSLQKGTRTTDYHGFLGAREELVASLRKIAGRSPRMLVPSHGRIMTDPAAAIDELARRLDEVYDRYVAISALRYYFPDMFRESEGRPGHMAFAAEKTPPAFLRHIGTSWVIISESGGAFVMDCGSQRVVDELLKLIEKGEIGSVEALWVTHYHDDHVDAIPAFQKTFDAPCFTDRSVADVIRQPLAWRLPCISPSAARVDRVTKDGESWEWREFRLTAYHFPGQTLYHAGLLVEGRDVRMLFVGDSFTRAGIDDYCAPNRNWLGEGVGFDRCIALVEKLAPTHIFNCHVESAFAFTPEQCRFMRSKLAEREKLLARLLPWDRPNYGLDASWVRCFPYEQRSRPEVEVEIRVIVTNHSAAAQTAAARAVTPRAWRAEKEGAARAHAAAASWRSARIESRREGEIALRIRVPRTAPGRYVIPVDLRLAGRHLPQITEAILVIE